METFMSLTDTFKNLLFENDSSENQTGETQEKTIPDVNTSPTTSTTSEIQSPPQMNNAEQSKLFESMLMRVTDAVFSRTTTYVQFKNTLKSLEPVIKDNPSTLYKAAFATLASSIQGNCTRNQKLIL